MNAADINLTEDDFKMLIEALDHLPHKHLPIEMMGDLMIGMVAGGDAAREQRLKREMNQKMSKDRPNPETLKEDVKILQGKLIMFKRYLIQENALRQANEALKK
jgi:hypothetical protein